MVCDGQDLGFFFEGSGSCQLWNTRGEDVSTLGEIPKPEASKAVKLDTGRHLPPLRQAVNRLYLSVDFVCLNYLEHRTFFTGLCLKP